MSKVRILTAGDTSLSIEFGDKINPDINEQVRAFNIALSKSGICGITETVPTYRSLMVCYDPAVIRYTRLIEALQAVSGQMDEMQIPSSQVLEIPVLYGGDAGPDLAFVAAYHHKTEEDVIQIHTSSEYLIYMLGFTPGFAYLGGMREEIATPRLESPRIKIPAGSVGIAGAQTGIYPIDSPGGWQLIGRTPVHMYDPNRPDPILPRAGQYIRFYPIGQEEYDRIAAEEATGSYRVKTYPKGAVDK